MAPRAKHPGGRPPKDESERFDVQLGVRADAETVERLAAIVLKLRHLVTRATVARVAMRVGLQAVEEDPGMIFTEQPLTTALAERILERHWPSFAAGTGAEHVRGIFRVWILTSDTMVIHGKGEETTGMAEGESRDSYKDAIDKLAGRVRPERPLPWSRAK